MSGLWGRGYSLALVWQADSRPGGGSSNSLLLPPPAFRPPHHHQDLLQLLREGQRLQGQGGWGQGRALSLRQRGRVQRLAMAWAFGTAVGP